MELSGRKKSHAVITVSSWQAVKTLQEGIDNGAQPSTLLVNLQKKVAKGLSVEDACREELVSLL
jgi:hypothetical protein